MTDDFTRHVDLIRQDRPNLTSGEARFAAWQEGPEGLARRIEAEATTRLIEQTRGLNLLHNPGSETEPETYTVQVRNQPHRCGSLEVARDFHEIDGQPMGPSEVTAVNIWCCQYL